MAVAEQGEVCVADFTEGLQVKTVRDVNVNKHDGGGGTESLHAVAVLMQATVHSGASRHVAAAVAACLWRLAMGSTAGGAALEASG